MIKLISFDVGGTLYYTRPKSLNKISKLAEVLNIDESELRCFLKPLLYSTKIGIEDLVSAIDQKFSVDSLNLINQLYCKNKKRFMYKEVEFVLKSLIERGYELAIISNINNLNKYIDLEISKYFKYIIYSCDCGYCKPDKKIFEMLCNQANCHPSEVLHVGDNYISDYCGAKDAGLQSILLDRKGINSKTQKKISSLRQLLQIL